MRERVSSKRQGEGHNRRTATTSGARHVTISEASPSKFPHEQFQLLLPDRRFLLNPAAALVAVAGVFFDGSSQSPSNRWELVARWGGGGGVELERA